MRPASPWASATTESRSASTAEACASAGGSPLRSWSSSASTSARLTTQDADMGMARAVSTRSVISSSSVPGRDWASSVGLSPAELSPRGLCEVGRSTVG